MNQVLYTYSDLKYLPDLLSGKLWFSPTSEYNDIFEEAIFVQGDNRARAHTIEAVNAWLSPRVVRCFSPISSNSLMWAHYADSHRGVCVGYHYDKIYKAPNKNKDNRSISRVRYCSSPPKPFVSREPTVNEINLMAMDVLLTKSTDWSYEQEYRVFTENEVLSKAGGGLIDLGVDSVVEVVFGAKVGVDVIEKLYRSLPISIPCRQVRKDHKGLSYSLDTVTHKFS